MKIKLNVFCQVTISIVLFLMMVSFVHSTMKLGVTLAQGLTSQTKEQLITGKFRY